MGLANRLKVLRAERDISQQTLAEATGLSRQTVNSIERGKFNPSVVSALRMAEYLGVAVEEIFRLSEDR